MNRKNNRIKFGTSIIVGVLSVGVLLLFCFLYTIFPQKVNPNVFLTFQYSSKKYYKIVINHTVIIDSEGIKRLKYENVHYKIKGLNLKLDKGNYIIQIKDSNNIIKSESNFIIDNQKLKYIYLRKEITIRDKPFVLI